MKKYMILFLSIVGFGSSAFAQKPRTTTFEDYFRYIDKSVEMEFRNSSIKMLGLTSEEIEEFDPVFRTYMDKKEASFDKKMALLDEFKKEIAEDDSRKNEEEDRAEFIEDYWGLEIADMKLRKNYFDILEDKIPVDKASRFFLWEKAAEDKMTRNVINQIIPSLGYYNTRYEAVDKSAMTDLAEKKSNIPYADKTKEEEDYLKYINAKLNMEFRNKTIEVLNLNEEEILAFDPFFKKYMSAKEALLQNRLELLEDYKSEMEEDDSAKNQAEDRADYFEDYWELDIAEAQMKKNYFDMLEDRIPPRKAAKFFLWEDAVEKDITRSLMYDIIPDMIIIDRIPSIIITSVEVDSDSGIDGISLIDNQANLSAETKDMIASFSKWFDKNNGKVDKSHEYTSDGLKALVNTLESVKNDMNVNIPDFQTKKSMILANAEKITKNWKSTDHADMTKDAFVAVAGMMSNIVNNSDRLQQIANSMNKDQLMTKQSDKIYQFFSAANTQLSQLADAPKKVGSHSINK